KKTGGNEFPRCFDGMDSPLAKFLGGGVRAGAVGIRAVWCSAVRRGLMLSFASLVFSRFARRGVLQNARGLHAPGVFVWIYL
ncbi:MAG: hypothetical protein LBQ91_06205, partial [Oscillospiraceae bacterium]|nr:hypothetical protein [Oscillospiraceae bacterium]